MLSYSNWLQGTATTTQQRTARDQARAADAWRRIQEKPTAVVLKTAAGVNRASQTMRLEVDNRASVGESAAGVTPRMNVILYGVRGHATLTDTAMAEGDRFNYLGDQYTIQDIILVPGEIQGVGVASG